MFAYVQDNAVASVAASLPLKWRSDGALERIVGFTDDVRSACVARRTDRSWESVRLPIKWGKWDCK